jgi:rhodanese-related sulfurtransferase
MSDTEIRRIDPIEAQAVLDQNPRALLIDVRTRVEFDYVGHPPGALHIPWKEFPEWIQDPNFAAAVGAALEPTGDAGKDRPLLLICRSGARSLKAAECLQRHGYTRLYNVEEGFEGDRDDQKHRSTINGWRFRGLPWEQG